VRDGVPGTAMVAWGEQLPPADLIAAASFVITLRGTNVPGGKSPEGAPVEAFAP
jgi:cytochrome c oxidase cbb3-type subunit 3